MKTIWIMKVKTDESRTEEWKQIQFLNLNTDRHIKLHISNKSEDANLMSLL